MHISKINVTPVKGLRIQAASSVILGPDGAQGNRRFYLVDEAGHLMNGKFIGELSQVVSHYDADANRLRLEFPDGAVVDGTAHLADAVVETSFYGRPVYGREVLGPWAEKLSALAGRRLRLVAVLPGITATDCEPVTLISTATLDYLRERAGGPTALWNERFRMLLEVDGVEPFAEDEWIGSALQVGDARLRVTGAIGRSIVTTRNPVSGVPDAKTLIALRAVRQEHPVKKLAPGETHRSADLLLGVYTEVMRPGRVEPGTRVAVI